MKRSTISISRSTTTSSCRGNNSNNKKDNINGEHDHHDDDTTRTGKRIRRNVVFTTTTTTTRKGTTMLTNSVLNAVVVLVVVLSVVCVVVGRGGGGGGSYHVSASSTITDENTNTYLNEDSIITRVNVQEYADLSLDVRDIRTFASSSTTTTSTSSGSGNNNEAAILGLYTQGLHSSLLREGFHYSLQQLSLDIANEENGVKRNPYYMKQLYGLSDRRSTHVDELNAVSKYADNIIQDIILNTHTVQYSAEAIVVLAMIPYSIYLLEDGIRTCSQRTLADQPNMIPLYGAGMDEFIGLYIGTDQPIATNTGHGLYSWTQEIYNVFHQQQQQQDDDDEFGNNMGNNIDHDSSFMEDEADVNRKLKLLYQQGVSALAIPNACTAENPTTIQSLYDVTIQMKNTIMISIFRWLLYSISIRDDTRIQIYSTTLVPQLASSCKASLYKTLRDQLLLLNGGGEGGGSIDYERSSDIIYNIYRVADDCYSISCSDIGTYNDAGGGFGVGCDMVVQNDDDEDKGILAGYQTSSDVRMLSKIDLDVLEMTTLTQLGELDGARYIYMYGSHVQQTKEGGDGASSFDLLSLQEMATRTDRNRIIPTYTDYERYYNDKNYADTVMMAAFDQYNANDDVGSSSKWSSVQQRAQEVQITSTCQILYMEALGYLHDANSLCEAASIEQQQGDSDIASSNSVTITSMMSTIDKASALLIGSMEGSNHGGSIDLDDGQLIYNINNQQSFHFNTVNINVGYSVVNMEFIDLLYASKGELSAIDCNRLSTTIKRIEKLLMVGITQSIIHAAINIVEHDIISYSYARTTTTSSVTTDNGSISSSSDAAADISLVDGEVYSLSILPIIDAMDASTAELIKENMITKIGVKPIRDGVRSVADAFGYLYVSDEMKLSCHHYIGSTTEIDPCRNIDPTLNQGPEHYYHHNGNNESSSTTSTTTPRRWFVTFSTMLLTIVLFVL